MAGMGGSKGVPMPVVVGCDGLAGIDKWENITPVEFTTPPNMEAMALAVDPQSPNIVYSAAGNVTDGPACPSGQICPSGSTGLYKSTDCGSHWQKISTGNNAKALETGNPWSLRIDPANPKNMVMMNGYGRPPTLFRSTNGGVDWTNIFEGAAVFKAFQYGGFARSFDLDPTDANHIVVAFHEPCLGPVANNAPKGVTCLGESKDGGSTWQLVVGPVPVTSADGGAPTVLGGPSWMYTDPSGGYYTADSGQTWKQVVTWAMSSGFYPVNQGAAYFGPDGALYFGTALGVIVSRATAANPLGASWTSIPKAHKAMVIIGDGARLFTSWSTDTANQSFYVASLTNPAAFTAVGSPSMSRGAGTVAYDPVHHLLFAASWSAGLWRMVTR
jgi:photosystem II stability/assembly factor-like uncharacterized protein